LLREFLFYLTGKILIFPFPFDHGRRLAAVAAENARNYKVKLDFIFLNNCLFNKKSAGQRLKNRVYKIKQRRERKG